MDFNTLQQNDTTYIANTYARTPLAIKEGFSATCYDLDGKQYIDFSSGIGVNSLGFANEQWVKSVTDQVNHLAHISNLYYTLPQVALAEQLCAKTGMKKVFFGNSGAEANEGAIKTARKYSSDKYDSSRCEIITLENSFHGRTIATLAATGQDVFHKNFGPFPDGFLYAEANNLEAMQAKISPKTCAIMIELIQGEGGVVPLEKEYVAALGKLCREKDILLLVDEVQTGIGRTGTFLATEQYDIQPDIITLAKGLGGGLPIGAVLFGEKTENTLGYSDHGTTFGGNPIVAAGAVAVLESVTDTFLKEVTAKGEYITEQLKTFPHITSISGKGLMLGIELDASLQSAAAAKQLAEAGLIILTAKHKLRMLPPLTISYEEIDAGLAILSNLLQTTV